MKVSMKKGVAFIAAFCAIYSASAQNAKVKTSASTQSGVEAPSAPSPIAVESTPVKDVEWKLVWSDEFNADGAPNSEFWNFERGFVRNMEFQWYQPDNAYCKDGLLVIEGRRETLKNPNYKEGATYWAQSRPTAEYTSSSITTKGKKEFQYGRIEVKARIPFGKGAWPAIWLLGNAADGTVWPHCGEIDIMEFYRIKGVPTILANAAWGGSDLRTAVWDDAKIPTSHFLAKDPDWHANFHVWRMDWDENFIRIYLDDELLNEIDLSKTFNKEHGKFLNPFRKPHYILLNLAIGGNGGGTPDENAYPMKYEIDYVRVYQPK